MQQQSSMKVHLLCKYYSKNILFTFSIYVLFLAPISSDSELYQCREEFHNNFSVSCGYIWRVDEGPGEKIGFINIHNIYNVGLIVKKYVYICRIFVLSIALKCMYYLNWSGRQELQFNFLNYASPVITLITFKSNSFFFWIFINLVHPRHSAGARPD